MPIKSLLKAITPEPLAQLIKKNKNKQVISKWRAKGSPAPAPHPVKQATIKEYQQRYNSKTLVETGTFLGDMVEAQKNNFSEIYSIELSEELYHKAVKRFKKEEHVQIVQGDSGKVLPKILSKINNPAVFWLDGHYSAGFTARGDKDCPIYEELTHILNHPVKGHVLLIDDARCFVGAGDYPTVEELQKFINERDGNYQLAVADDIIRFTYSS